MYKILSGLVRSDVDVFDLDILLYFSFKKEIKTN
jgi:hypothetical protein